MSILSSIKNRIISIIQLILVFIYIIFEEIIWDGIAKPIYEAIRSLKILQTLEVKLQTINASFILSIFVVLLIVVEGVGIYAGMLFVSGQMALGIALYISKIPIAGFTFWLFRVTEDKLMQFGWFKWLYDWIMRGIVWLKSSEIHKSTMVYLSSIKLWFREFKLKHFSQSSPFITKIKEIYRSLKNSLKR
ncbi:MAG: hypothetical protein QM493_01825 [Sulfurovum sp.]